jgi:hypothetical protein
MFRVHPKLLGIPAADGADKADDVQRIFDNNTLQPFFTVMAKRITRALTGVRRRLQDRPPLPSAEAGPGQAGGRLRVDPWRHREGGPRVPRPAAVGDKAIDDLVLNLPGDNGLPGDTRNGIPDRNLPGEAGRPPNGANTASFGTVGGGSRP